MAHTGSFGEIVFESSSEQVKTWSAFRREHSASFVQHEVAEGKARLEFTGIGLKLLNMEVQLNSVLGADPEADLLELQELMQEGEPRVLVIGDRPQGEYVLENMTEERLRTDGRGRTMLARVQLSFREYN